MDERTLFHELRPAVESLIERHLASAREWFPHEFVPWSRGRDFAPDYTWEPGEFPMPDAVRSALIVNLLTEDNLPYYFTTINRLFGREGSDAWGEWTRRWTAEEMRHAMVIRDYLVVTRAVDPVALERDRMVQVSGGKTPEPPTVTDGLVYLCLQELATRIAHRNTGKLLPDAAGYEVMSRVAADENLHYLFYRDLAAAAIELDPSGMVAAIERQVRDFQMPGTGIPRFAFHAVAIAKANIYNLSIHHEHILLPVIQRHWAVDELNGLSPEAEAARERLLGHMVRIADVARRQAERQAERQTERRSVPQEYARRAQ